MYNFCIKTAASAFPHVFRHSVLLRRFCKSPLPHPLQLSSERLISTINSKQLNKHLYHGITCEDTHAIPDLNFQINQHVSTVLEDLKDSHYFSSIGALRNLMRNLKLFKIKRGSDCNITEISQLIKELDLMYKSYDLDSNPPRRLQKSKAESTFVHVVTNMLRKQHSFYENIQCLYPNGGYPYTIYELSHNEFLDGCFEADIVIRAVKKNANSNISEPSPVPAPALIYNIEVDEPKSLEKKERLALRDKYLINECGIQIARIELKEKFDECKAEYNKEAEVYNIRKLRMPINYAKMHEGKGRLVIDALVHLNILDRRFL